MKCGDVMTKEPTCCIPTDSAARAAKLMKTEGVGSIPVCQSRHDRKLVGIVTDRDLAMQVVAEGKDPNSVRVQDIMTQDPFTCRPEEDLQKALDAMQTHQVRRIPVVDESDRLTGIIAQADVATRARQTEQTAKTVERISRGATQTA
jgi:CBS domain-containing protein